MHQDSSDLALIVLEDGFIAKGKAWGSGDAPWGK